MSGLRQRLVASGFSNLYGLAANLGAQLLLLPLFLRAWGAQGYGEWLVIAAIPTYFSLSEVGLTQAGVNHVVMLHARGNFASAREIFRILWIFTTVLTLAGAAVVLSSFSVVPWASWLGLGVATATHLPWLLAGLVISTGASWQSALAQALYRCAGKNAVGVFTQTNIRAVESVAMATVLAMRLGMKELVLVMLVVRVLGAVWMFMLGGRYCSALRPFFGPVSFRGFSQLWRPAVGQCGLALGNSILIQGFTLLINAHLGPVAVTTFNLVRSVTRLVIQVITVINSSIYPEFSSLIAAGELAAARRLHRLAVQASLLVCVLGSVGLVAFGPQLIDLWSLGKVRASHLLIGAFAVDVMLNVCWNTSSVVLSSTNRHARLGVFFALGTVAVLLLANVAVPVFALSGAVTALNLIDLIMALFVFRLSCRSLADGVGAALRDVLTLRALRNSWGARASPSLFRSSPLAS